jgi:hypothetical protein
VSIYSQNGLYELVRYFKLFIQKKKKKKKSVATGWSKYKIKLFKKNYYKNEMPK